MTRRQAGIGVRLAVLTVLVGMVGGGVGIGRAAQPGQTAQGLPAEGRLDAFLGVPEFAVQQVFQGDRFPNVVVATDGTVLAFWNGVKVRRSGDGGKTWGEAILAGKGFMGGGVTVDETSGDILAFVEHMIFSNIVSPGPRQNGHVWASFDGGRTWPVRRQVYEGPFAYSSLDARRPGTPSEGWIYLLFEGGPQGGGTIARFNLSWLLGGEKTGDGELPPEAESKR